MRGPLPKPDHERLRRNKEDRFVQPKGGARPPEPRDYKRWSQAGRDWWDAVCETPEAEMFTPANWQIALRVPRLLILGNTRALAEIREIEASLLLTPLAMRRARVDLDDETTEDVTEDIIDYRSRLKAI